MKLLIPVLVTPVFALVHSAPLGARPADLPRTGAERSAYRATSHYQDVVDFASALAQRSPRVRLEDIGTSVEGRRLIAFLLSEPRVSKPEDLERSEKPLVLLLGGMHGGEVDGKEALLELARELSQGEQPLLRSLTLAFVPLLNPDGNERVSTENRRDQAGPEAGVGARENAQGLDLNRDWVKLEAPETRAVLRFVRRWDPLVVVDTHTTDGSAHRYAVTFEGPKHPAGNPALLDYVRDDLLGRVRDEFLRRTGRGSFFYGNFSADRSRWETFPALPRFGSVYFGLRGRADVLVESYAYLPFAERIASTREFVRVLLEEVAAPSGKRRGVTHEPSAAAKSTVDSRQSTVKGGERPRLAVRTRAVPAPERVEVQAFEAGASGHPAEGPPSKDSRPRDWSVQLLNRFEAEREVALPFAYVFDARHEAVRENLLRHGVAVEELREDVEVPVESLRVAAVDRDADEFQGHRLVRCEVECRGERRRLSAGSCVVETGRELGVLAAYLLEPESEDGLCAWNFFDDALLAGEDYPVLRLPAPVALLTAPLGALVEDRKPRQPLTFAAVYESERPPSFHGSPPAGLEWLDDEHYLEVREGKLSKVHAASGRAEAFVHVEALSASLAALPAIGREAAARLASSASLHLDPAKAAALFEYERDLYHARLDGSRAVRLTSSPEDEELASFSPDSSHVAFVRENDLWVIDVETRTERALTTGGHDRLRHGKADWVYFEEVFNRSWKAYWWSPDSRRIAFLRVDSTPVPTFTLVDELPERQALEAAPFPKPGQPNPIVGVGVVSIAGGEPRWAKLGDYDDRDVLVTGLGWCPDGESLYVCVQDRVQTWLDFVRLGSGRLQPQRLFRETTGAWVEPLDPPAFLADGSFLVQSERSGWKHLYHYRKSGDLERALTSGEWEVRRLLLVHQESGWVYFAGTKDSHLGPNLYRVRLDGSGLEWLTQAEGSHDCLVSPRGSFFIDTSSSRSRPAQAALFDASGNRLRWIDTNPVRALDEYLWAQAEPLQVRARDGFALEASLLKPLHFDPRRRYPVWLMTYGGPHAPTVADAWSWSWAWDQVLAQSGLLVFRVDPRSASGKGAASAWTAYKQLGVQELADLEDAVAWLRSQPFVDAGRIGLSGHSYGGFLTAYALTRSRSFAAGISGAPVTDWRDYDSIYTERYMLTPQANPEGYAKTSVVARAADLHGRLLLLHGDMDDNVHAQNSIRFIAELQKAQKQFEFMVYPGARHGIGGRHYRRLVYDFILRALDVKPASERTSPPVPEPQTVGGDGQPGKRRI